MQANCSVNSVNSVGVFTLYKYLCGSVQSVGEYPLPVCSVNSVNSVGGFNIGALSDMLVHFLLWQAAKPSGDKCTPLCAPLVMQMYCFFVM